MEKAIDQKQAFQILGNSAYEIDDNGKKRYLKATTVDIIVSVLLPFWGVLIGGAAALRGEIKRGQTMILLGVAGIAVYALLRAI